MDKFSSVTGHGPNNFGSLLKYFDIVKLKKYLINQDTLCDSDCEALKQLSKKKDIISHLNRAVWHSSNPSQYYKHILQSVHGFAQKALCNVTQALDQATIQGRHLSRKEATSKTFVPQQSDGNVSTRDFRCFEDLTLNRRLSDESESSASSSSADELDRRQCSQAIPDVSNTEQSLYGSILVA